MVSFLRAINVGGRNSIRMAELKALHEGLGLTEVQTVLQSGNVVFRAKSGTPAAITKKIAKALEDEHGLAVAVTVRSAAELRDIAARNPFPDEAKSDPSHLLVMMLADDPDAGAADKLAAIKVGRERTALSGRELFLVYPDGIGRSKLTAALLERAVGVEGTARNWNTLQKLIALTEAREPG